MSKEKIDEFIKKAFPENWFDYARELKEASLELWKSHSNTLILYNTIEEGTYSRKLYSRTYFILMGLSIENLLKGILISENPELIKDGIINNKISSGHNLEYLSKTISSIEFSDDENEIFKVLSKVIPYWGKYPIPKNFNKLESEIFMADSWFNNLIELYNKLEYKLCILNKNGIKGPNGIDFPKLYIDGITNK